MYHRKTLTVTISLLLLIIGLYLFTFMGKNIDFILPRRGLKIGAMLVISFAIGYSSIVFQTISSNRILTPSIMGFDSFYLFTQAVLVLFFGDQTYQMISRTENFGLSVLVMVGFALAMYYFVFRKQSKSIYILLLVGILLGTLFRSLSSFIAILLDPNEFMFVQNAMFASFENIRVDLLAIASVVLIATMLVGARFFKQLDVISLGRENAISLGVDYNKVVRINLILISIMVAIATALVGPITFLGLIVANLSYIFFKSNSHSHLIWRCCLLTAIIVITGQYLVEHLFNLSITLSIIINFIGGIYFIYILLKSNK